MSGRSLSVFCFAECLVKKGVRESYSLLRKRTPAARTPRSAPKTGEGAWVNVGEMPAAVVVTGAVVAAAVTTAGVSFAVCGAVAGTVAVTVAGCPPEDAVHFA